jgi:hypothetical protein
VGILERQRVANDEVKWAQVDAVLIYLNPADGSYSHRAHATSTSQAYAYGALFDKRREYLDADWIRPNLVQKRLADMGAFNLRRQGGVLFVARTYLEELANLARLVRALGDSTFDVIHVAATEESRQSVGRAAGVHLEDQINDLVAKLDGWQEAAKKPRADAVEHLLVSVGEIVLQGALYSDVLAVAMEKVDERLAAVKLRATELLMDGVEDAAA